MPNCSSFLLKNYQIPEINLIKDLKDFYNENYKTVLREIKEDLNKWRNVLFTDWKTQH